MPRSKRRAGVKPGKTKSQMALAAWTERKRQMQARAQQLRDQRAEAIRKHAEELSLKAKHHED